MQVHRRPSTSSFTLQESGCGSSASDQPLVFPQSVDQSFLSVLNVVPRSAAAEGGLRRGDLIVNFEDITKNNFCGVQLFCEIVRQNAGIPMRVEIHRPISLRRKSFPDSFHSETWVQALTLKLIPHRTHAGGVLGCVLTSAKPSTRSTKKKHHRIRAAKSHLRGKSY